MIAGDRILYTKVSRSGPTCVPVSMLDIFLIPILTAILDDVPMRISLPKIEYKPMTPAGANFTGHKDYLTKLMAYFSIEPGGPLSSKCFLLYGVGVIG